MQDRISGMGGTSQAAAPPLLSLTRSPSLAEQAADAIVTGIAMVLFPSCALLVALALTAIFVPLVGWRRPGDEAAGLRPVFTQSCLDVHPCPPGLWADAFQLPSWAPAGIGVNIAGLVAGSDPSLRERVVVVGAHYDHIGRLDRYSRDPDAIGIRPGADDNASGTAALLELARRHAQALLPRVDPPHVLVDPLRRNPRRFDTCGLRNQLRHGHLGRRSADGGAHHTSVPGPLHVGDHPLGGVGLRRRPDLRLAQRPDVRLDHQPH